MVALVLTVRLAGVEVRCTGVPDQLCEPLGQSDRNRDGLREVAKVFGEVAGVSIEAPSLAFTLDGTSLAMPGPSQWFRQRSLVFATCSSKTAPRGAVHTRRAVANRARKAVLEAVSRGSRVVVVGV